MFKSFYARYGSRKEFLDSKWHQLLFLLGWYKMYNIPWESIERLVFVCSGNICRSAFAEAVAKKIGIDAISVGVYAMEGALANDHAISIAQVMGYDLTEHRTTPIMYPILHKSDLLIAMEPWQATLVKQNLAQRYHTTLLGIWGTPIRPYISDPYMRSDAYFRHCFNYIEKCVHVISSKLQKTD